MLSFLLALLLKISKTLKLISLERKQISANSKKLSFHFYQSFISANKKLSKILMHKHFRYYTQPMFYEVIQYCVTKTFPQCKETVQYFVIILGRKHTYETENT